MTPEHQQLIAVRLHQEHENVMNALETVKDELEHMNIGLAKQVLDEAMATLYVYDNSVETTLGIPQKQKA